MRPTISLCMIVRDEEEFLDACLQSVNRVADEIVILDTGSTDLTVEIARSYGARVYVHPWNNSFSEARNAAIDLATGDWILVLDADERLDESSKQLIRSAVNNTGSDAYYLSQHNYTDSSTQDFIVNPTCRLWRNLPQNRYEGRVHERPTVLLRKHAVVGHIDAIIHHYGNQPRIFAERDKCSRYIELIQADLHDNPDDASKLHDMAISYYVEGRFKEALTYLLHAAEIVKPKSSLAGLVYSSLISAYYRDGSQEEAISSLNHALSLGVRHPEIHYAGGQAFMSLGRLKEAVSHFKKAIDIGSTGKWTGDAAAWGHKAQEAIAICCMNLGHYAEALEYGLEALQVTPDRDEIKDVVANACFHLGDALYSCADYSIAADFYSHGLSLTPGHAPGFFTLGNCYFNLGVFDAAVIAYRKALEINPDYSEAINNLEIAEEEIAQQLAA